MVPHISKPENESNKTDLLFKRLMSDCFRSCMSSDFKYMTRKEECQIFVTSGSPSLCAQPASCNWNHIVPLEKDSECGLVHNRIAVLSYWFIKKNSLFSAYLCASFSPSLLLCVRWLTGMDQCFIATNLLLSSAVRAIPWCTSTEGHTLGSTSAIILQNTASKWIKGPF
jgi:hypothetical protein